MPAATSISTTLRQLRTPFRRIAQSRATWMAEIEPADLEQVMALATVENYRADAGAGWHIRVGERRVRDVIRRQVTYRRYVSQIEAPDEERAATIVDYADLLPTPEESPEEQLIRKQRAEALFASLSQDEGEILSALLAGFSKGEIARERGVPPPRISTKLKRIRTIAAHVSIEF